MASMYMLSKKLLLAINTKYKCHLVMNVSSYFNHRSNINSHVNMYVIKEEYHFEDGERVNKEVFRSASLVYACLYLRDLLFTLEGKSIPLNLDDGWAKMRAKRDVDSSIAYLEEKYGDGRYW